MLAAYSQDVSYRFNRSWQVLVTTAFDLQGPDLSDGRSALVYGSIGSQEDPAAPIRVQFSVEMGGEGKDANKASVSLFNLSPLHRNALATGSFVQLRAGYGAACDVIFAGYAAKVETKQNGSDIVTTLDCGDSEPVLAYGWFHASYAEPTPLARILTDICKSLSVSFGGLTCNITAGVCFAIPNVLIPARAFAGACGDALTALLTPLNMRWDIINGSLNIAPIDAPLMQEAVVLSAETGLIGTPSHTETASMFSCLMTGGVSPGQLVEVVSKIVGMSGVFTVVKAKYTGDTHGDAWHVDLETTPVNPEAVVRYAALPVAKSLNLAAAL